MRLPALANIVGIEISVQFVTSSECSRWNGMLYPTPKPLPKPNLNQFCTHSACYTPAYRPVKSSHLLHQPCYFRTGWYKTKDGALLRPASGVLATLGYDMCQGNK